MKIWEWILTVLAAALIIFSLYKTAYPRSEPLMDATERKTMMEAQAKAAARRSKEQYVRYALRRAELPDNEFLDHGREDVRSLGQDLMQCWKDLDADEARVAQMSAELQKAQVELANIKNILLERKP